ncbi:hypothetical protein Trydic_g15434 [Trypoxylus dichotomus]
MSHDVVFNDVDDVFVPVVVDIAIVMLQMRYDSCCYRFCRRRMFVVHFPTEWEAQLVEADRFDGPFRGDGCGRFLRHGVFVRQTNRQRRFGSINTCDYYTMTSKNVLAGGDFVSSRSDTFVECSTSNPNICQRHCTYTRHIYSR